MQQPPRTLTPLRITIKLPSFARQNVPDARLLQHSAGRKTTAPYLHPGRPPPLKQAPPQARRRIRILRHHKPPTAHPTTARSCQGRDPPKQQARDQGRILRQYRQPSVRYTADPNDSASGATKQPQGDRAASRGFSELDASARTGLRPRSFAAGCAHADQSQLCPQAWGLIMMHGRCSIAVVNMRIQAWACAFAFACSCVHWHLGGQ